jgi:hypothetical protein
MENILDAYAVRALLEVEVTVLQLVCRYNHRFREDEGAVAVDEVALG